MENIKWLGHDAFKLVGEGMVIYIDPYELPETPEPADIILITHEHFDHCSPKEIKKLQKPETVIVCNQQCAEQLEGDKKVVKPGETIDVNDLAIKTVPAYNIDKFREPGLPFHPKPDDKLGFIIELEGQKIYHAGDTDNIPEMEGLDVDIALLPVSGTYVMTAEEAAEAVKRIKPKIAVPMHYGSIVGSKEDAEKFKKLVGKEAQVQILEKTA